MTPWEVMTAPDAPWWVWLGRATVVLILPVNIFVAWQWNRLNAELTETLRRLKHREWIRRLREEAK